MKQERAGLGRLGTRFFELMQMREQEVITIGELQTALEISKGQEKKLLSQLAKQGLIVRLQKGIYLVPTKLPPGGRWSPSEYRLIAEYMGAIGARYQICGPAAFNYHKLSEQIPNRIAIYNDKISGIKKVGSLQFQLIKVPIKRIGGWTTMESREPQQKQARISTISRTLVDALYDWSRFNSIPKVFSWIASYSTNPKNVKELINCIIQFGNTGSKRRVGYFLERLGIDSKDLGKLYRSIKSTNSWIPLNPNLPLKGKTIKRWGVIDNDPS